MSEINEKCSLPSSIIQQYITQNSCEKTFIFFNIHCYFSKLNSKSQKQLEEDEEY